MKATDADLAYLQRWYREKFNPLDTLLNRVRPVIGWGSTEEKLIRLMVWCGTVLLPRDRDTGLSDPVDLFISGEGQCRQQSFFFVRLASALVGVRGRPIGLYHTDGINGHVVAEVEYDDAWHLFDPGTNYLSIYRHPSGGHVMSYDEISTNLDVVASQDNWFRGADGIGKEGFFRQPREEFTYVHFEIAPWMNLVR